jgi:hypothetical protein
MNTNWKCKTIKSAGSAAKGNRQADHMTKSAGIASEGLIFGKFRLSLCL